MRGRAALLRGVPWPPVLFLTGGGATLLGVGAAVPSTSPATRLAGAGLALLAAGSAWSLDEPAAAAVDAAPCSLKVRNLLRGSMIGLPVALSALAVVLARIGQSGAPFWRLQLQILGVLAVAVAATACVRRSYPTPGELVGPTLALVIVGFSAFDPLARWLPILPLVSDRYSAGTSAVWVLATGAGLVIFLRASRDRLDL